MRVVRARHGSGASTRRVASQEDAREPQSNGMTDGTQPSAQPVPNWLRNGGATGSLIHSINWGTTPLGPLSNWSPELKASLAFCLSSRLPLAISWGADQITLYNDAFCALLGEKHPESMGQQGRKCW